MAKYLSVDDGTWRGQTTGDITWGMCRRNIHKNAGKEEKEKWEFVINSHNGVKWHGGRQPGNNINPPYLAFKGWNLPPPSFPVLEEDFLCIQAWGCPQIKPQALSSVTTSKKFELKGLFAEQILCMIHAVSIVPFFTGKGVSGVFAGWAENQRCNTCWWHAHLVWLHVLTSLHHGTLRASFTSAVSSFCCEMCALKIYIYIYLYSVCKGSTFQPESFVPAEALPAE